MRFVAGVGNVRHLVTVKSVRELKAKDALVVSRGRNSLLGRSCKKKKLNHRCRYDRCKHGWLAHSGFSLIPIKGKVGMWKCRRFNYCKCGKKRPLNNKVEGR